MFNSEIMKLACVSGLVFFCLYGTTATASGGKSSSHSGPDSRAEYMQKLKPLVRKIETRLGKTLVASDETEKALIRISASLSNVDYSELLAVLRLNGFTAYMGGRFIYIIPLKEARASPVPILEGDKTFPLDQYVSTIISMEKACAFKLIPVLRPAVPFHSHLSYSPSGRQFYLTDSYGNVMRIKKLITEFDARESEVQPCDIGVLEKIKQKRSSKPVAKKQNVNRSAFIAKEINNVL